MSLSFEATSLRGRIIVGAEHIQANRGIHLAAMMKRNTKESVQDALASKEIYVTVSKTPAVTKVIWHIDPTSLDNDEDLRRNPPESKYLKGLSACLTLMVLWGIFWQIHNHLIPQILPGYEAASGEDSFTLARMQSDADTFQGDVSADLVSSIGGRRTASKLLLEVHEQFPNKQKQTSQTSWGGSLGPVLHREPLSNVHHATTN